MLDQGPPRPFRSRKTLRRSTRRFPGAKSTIRSSGTKSRRSTRGASRSGTRCRWPGTLPVARRHRARIVRWRHSLFGRLPWCVAGVEPPQFDRSGSTISPQCRAAATSAPLLSATMTTARRFVFGERPGGGTITAAEISDTPSVGHLRNYSKYLIPAGARDLLTGVAIVRALDKLVANIGLTLPIVLLLAAVTIWSTPLRVA